MSVLLIKIWWALMLLGEEAEAELLSGSEEEQSSTVCVPSLWILCWGGMVQWPQGFCWNYWGWSCIFNVGTAQWAPLSLPSSSDSNCLVWTQGLFCWGGCEQFSTLHFGVFKCMGKDFHYGSLVGWASVLLVSLLQLREPLGLFSNFLGFISSSVFDFQPDTQLCAKSWWPLVPLGVFEIVLLLIE